MPLLTIILPTYNGALFLGPQIDSILAQSHRDFVLLIIDDGSSDGTSAIIDHYVARDRRVRRLPSEGNMGQRIRLRQLAEAVSTEFLAIADQDDVWHPERNALLLGAIGTRAVAFGRSQLIDTHGQDLGRSILERLKIDPHQAGPLHSLFRPLVSGHAAIIRHDWLDLAVFSGFAPFDVAIARDALFSAGLVYIDEAIVYHRIHAANQMNGALANGRTGGRLSLYRLRVATSFVRLDRILLFLAFDQLSRSTAVDASIRSVAARVAHVCRFTWFQPLRFGFGNGRRLERELDGLLGPFAGSETDLAYLRDRLRSLSRPQWSPINVARGVSHYRGREC